MEFFIAFLFLGVLWLACLLGIVVLSWKNIYTLKRAFFRVGLWYVILAAIALGVTFYLVMTE